MAIIVYLTSPLLGTTAETRLVVAQRSRFLCFVRYPPWPGLTGLRSMSYYLIGFIGPRGDLVALTLLGIIPLRPLGYYSIARIIAVVTVGVAYFLLALDDYGHGPPDQRGLIDALHCDPNTVPSRHWPNLRFHYWRG